MLRIQDRDKRRHRTTFGGGTPHRTNVYWEGGTPHILSRYFNKGGDTAQIQSGVYSARKSIWSVGGCFFQESDGFTVKESYLNNVLKAKD